MVINSEISEITRTKNYKTKKYNKILYKCNFTFIN